MDARSKYRLLSVVLIVCTFLFVCLVDRIEIHNDGCASGLSSEGSSKTPHEGMLSSLDIIKDRNNAKDAASVLPQNNIGSQKPIVIEKNEKNRSVYLIYDFDHGRGLGNCLFRVASIYGIAKSAGKTPIFRYNTKVKEFFNVDWPKPTNVDESVFEQMKTQFGGGAEFSEKYYLEARDSGYNLNLKGYYQSWKYFNNHSADVRSMLTFKSSIADAAKRFLDKQRVRYAADGSAKVIFIGVHVRRGDIVTDGFLKQGYTTPPVDYYVKSMKFFGEVFHTNTIIFVLCTNDANWTQENLGTIHGFNIVVTQNDQGLDLAILSHCDHVIMSVGTYSWWAAWLANGMTVYYDLWPAPGSWLDRKTKREDYFMPYWIPMH